MKKKFIFSILIVAILTFTFSVYAEDFAITTDATKQGTTDLGSKYVTNKGNLKITNATEGDSLKAYKILDTYYNSDTNIVTYEFTSSFKAFLAGNATYQSLTVEQYAQLTSGSKTDGKTKTNSSLDTLASLYAAYVKTNSIQGEELTNFTADLDAGSYLILPTSTTSVYAVMVGNIELKADTGNKWKLENEEIVAKVSAPAVTTKTFKADGAAQKSFNTDETFTYRLTGTIPAYPTNSINKTYRISDVLGSGITFGGINTVKVIIGEDELTVSEGKIVSGTDELATVEFNSSTNTLSLAFDLSKINVNSIAIEYDAKLESTNNNLVVGGDGNINTVTLTYSKDPYSNDASALTTTTKSATAYTYGIEALKYTANPLIPSDKSKVLQGAVFEIYKNSADASDSSKKLATITTNENGIAKYFGLEAGTYYLKEVKAPAGHTLLTNLVEVDLNPATTTLAVSEVNVGFRKVDVPDPESLKLPFTGGIGTIIFTVIGVLLVSIASTIFVAYKKKHAYNN